jgi:hypothetical protein
MSNQPWDRQRKDGKLEPMLWFDRFELWRKTGPGRKLLTVVNVWRVQNGQKESNYTPGSWRKAFDDWSWQTRAEAWDEHERQRIEAKFQAECDEWRRGRFEDAQKLREKARGYLSFPVSKRTVSEDGHTYVIEALPTNYAKDAAAILKIADELARTTTRETLPVHKVAPTTPDGEKSYQPLDLENLTDAELERLGRLFAKIET